MSLISDIEAGSKYIKWNDRLAGHFFNEEAGGKEVLLFVTKEAVDEIGRDLGGFDDFLACVQAGPWWVTRQGLCQKALQSYENWRSKNLIYPPYIGYLVLFVLAEDIEGDFSAHSYYPRLWNLLGEPDNTRPLPSFDEMWQLWVDLEKWSREDKNEEMGRFTFQIRGGMVHVGIPLSQTLLSIEERKRLPIVFANADLDPTSIPSTASLVKAISTVATVGHLLFPRTVRLLLSNTPENQPLKEALLEVIVEELSRWDGVEPSQDSEQGDAVRSTRAGLRVCLQVDLLAKRISPYLRFKSNREIPDNGLNFSVPDTSNTLACRESHAGWSTPLVETSSGSRFDASTINWNNGLVLIDNEYHWRALFKEAPVRLFVTGKGLGLKDWVETQKLERIGKYTIACSNQFSEKVRSWAQDGCEQFEEENFTGLPIGWNLFQIQNPARSCDGIEILSLSSDLRLLLEGGIRIGRGNRFLSLAPPAVVLENFTGGEQVFLNDIRIERETPEHPVWRLPHELSFDIPLKISVKQDGADKNISRTIRVLEPEISIAFESIRRDRYGNPITAQDGMPYLSAVELHGVPTEPFGEIPSTLPTYLSDKIIFVGPKPGQIFEWPKEKLPEDWDPLWAIAKKGRREWSAHLCGKPDNLSAKYQSDSGVDSSLVRRWREAIWVNRKITEPPALPFLRSGWKIFVECAKNAR